MGKISLKDKFTIDSQRETAEQRHVIHLFHHIRRPIVDRIDTTSAHCMVNQDYTKLIKW